jgi:hypothetical protein
MSSCSDSTRYNGWHNYETWAVNLHLTNDQGQDHYWRETARELFRNAVIEDESYNTPSEQARFDLADTLKDELAHDGDPAVFTANVSLPGLFSDLLQAAFSEVNWNEIANAFLEDAQTEVDGQTIKYEMAKEA